MYYRYFKAGRGSPLFKEVQRIVDERRAANPVLTAFSKKIGASAMYGNNPANYLFDFPTSKDADPLVWRKTKPHRGTYYFTPRKSTPEGKAMAERIKQLPAMPLLNQALQVVPDLHVGFPCIIEGNTGYSPHLRYYSLRRPALVIIQVPWQDADPKELKAYAKQRKGKNPTHYSAKLDHLLWTPPTWLTELKEWEALKVIDP